MSEPRPDHPRELTLRLPPALNDFVAQQAQRENHGDAHAYVVSLINAAAHESEAERLQRLILDGLGSGTPVLADESFWARRRSELVSRHGRA